MRLTASTSENVSGLTKPETSPSMTPATPATAALAAKPSADCASGAMPIVRATTGWVLAATSRIRTEERRTASPAARQMPRVPITT